MEIGVHRHRWFNTPVEPGEKAAHEILLIFCYSVATTLIICLFSGLHSSLFYARTAKLVQAQVCVGDMHVSCLQAKGWQHHLSQNIGLAIAGVTENLIVWKYRGVHIS